MHPNDGYVAPPNGASRSSNSPPAEDVSRRYGQHQVNNPTLAPDTNIILCISLASGSTRFSYVYIADNERHLQAALLAYFDFSGHTMAVFLCLDFDAFMADHAITNSNINFISNLPSYIIPTGTRILEAAQYNELPNKDWLPAPPDLLSFASSFSSPSLVLDCRSCLPPVPRHPNDP
jgi:hypothetical protein